MVTLNGKIVTLRPVKLSDAKAISELVNDIRICKWVSALPWPYKYKDAKDFVKRAVAQNNKKNGYAINFTIISNETKKLAGCIRLYRVNYSNRHAEIGTWLGVNYWGKGFNTESKKLILNYAFNKLGMHKIISKIFEKNIRSITAFEKLGAKREGFLRDHAYKLGKFHNEIQFGILNSDWKPEKLKF